MTQVAEFKGPIVEGAWYERGDGSVGVAQSYGDVFRVCNDTYLRSGRNKYKSGHALTRRVYLVPTDPAEVVAELRQLAGIFRHSARVATNGPDALSHGAAEHALIKAADLVAEKLGVKP